jgi:hypothetical protein
MIWRSLMALSLGQTNKEPTFMPLILTGDKGGKKFAQVMIFYENLSDYLPTIKRGRQSHRRDYSMNFIRKSESLHTETEDEINYDPQNTSMIQIMNDYIDKCEYQNTEKLKTFNGKNYFVPKAIVLISELPIFETMKSMLSILYKQSIYRINYPIDCYLYYLTYEVPLPAFGTNVK